MLWEVSTLLRAGHKPLEFAKQINLSEMTLCRVALEQACPKLLNVKPSEKFIKDPVFTRKMTLS